MVGPGESRIPETTRAQHSYRHGNTAATATTPAPHHGRQESENIGAAPTEVAARYETLGLEDFERAVRLGHETVVVSATDRPGMETMALSGGIRSGNESVAVSTNASGRIGAGIESVSPSAGWKTYESTAVGSVQSKNPLTSGVEQAATSIDKGEAQVPQTPGFGVFFDLPDSSFDEKPSLQRQLLRIQEEEAARLVNIEDYKAADKIISDILQSGVITADEKVLWLHNRVSVVQLQGEWQESLRTLKSVESLIDPDNKLRGRQWRMRAEAEQRLGANEYARGVGTKALVVLEENGTETDKDRREFYACIDLMARIAEKTGRQVEAKFYRSKVAEGYVEPGQANQRRRSQKEDEAAAIRLSAFLGEYNLRQQNGTVIGDDEMYLAAFEAALHNSDKDPETLAFFLTEPTATQRSGPFGRTCLFHAIVCHNLTAIAALLDRDPATVNEKYRTANSKSFTERLYFPLDTAICRWLEAKDEFLKVITLLLDHGARPGVSGIAPSALVLAAQMGHNPVVKLLLEKGAEFIVPGQETGLLGGPTTVLHYAAESTEADMETFSLLCTAAPSEINYKDGSGLTPVHTAVRYQNFTATRALCELGADIRSSDFMRRTPLHQAIGPTATLLIQKGADVNATDTGGWTPLHFAALIGSPEESCETVKILCNYGADANRRNVDGSYPIHFAATKGNRDAIRSLYTQNPNIDVKNKKWETPLDCAWRHRELIREPDMRRYAESISYLLKLGARFSADPVPDPTEVKNYLFNK